MPGQEALAREIVARLSAGTASSDEVFTAFEELDQLPVDVVRQALEPWTGPAPDLERLDDTMRRAHRLPLRTPTLKTLASARDADVLDLGPTAETQLRIAGKTWDGQDLEPEERLDGEREDSFAGTLERRVLGERDRAVFDVMLFGEGSGVIFCADTTTVVGVIVDHRVETRDRPARAALEHALSTPSTPPPSLSDAVTLRQPPQLELGFVAPPPVPAIEPPVAVEVEVEEDEDEDEDAPVATAPASPGKKKTAAKKKAAAAAPKKKAAAAAPKKKAAAATAPAAPAKKKAAAKKKTVAKKKASADE